MNGFERVLGATIGFRLAEAEVGQFALDDIDQTGIHRRRRACVPVVLGQCGEARVLVLEVTQDVLQAVLDPSEIAGTVIAGGLQAFEQVRHALFEMGESGLAVIADRHAVEAVGQRPQRAFEIFRMVICRRPFAAFQRRGQRRDALLQDCIGIVVGARLRQLVDLGRQRADVVGKPDQGVVGGYVGDDGAKRRDGAFELQHR